jgi:methylmalonyl-CoA/ethylmalonyl-CoA epimerase
MNDNWKSKAGSKDLGAFDHIALLVEDIETETEMYRSVYGAGISATEENRQYGISSVFVDLGYARLRLLQPHGHDSAVTGLMAPHDWAGVHHVCYKVDDIVQMRDRLRDEGCRPLSEDEFKRSAQGKLIVFLRPSGGRGPLIKLEQR